MDRLLADTGFRVAAGQRGDPLHEAAKNFLSRYSGTLVWLSEESGLRRILAVDRSDFSLFRLKGGKRFDVLDWF